MRAAVALGDIVGVGRERFVVGIVPLHGDFHVDRDFFTGILSRFLHHRLLDVDRIFVDGVARRVFIENEGADAAFAFKPHVFAGTFVVQFNVHAGIQERQLAQAVQQRIVVEVRNRHEDGLVGEEMHFRAALIGGPQILHRTDLYHFARDGILHRLNFAVDGDAVFKADEVRAAVAVHLQFQPGREGVHTGNADTVKAAGNFVAVIVEFAAGMQFRKGNFRGGTLGFVFVIKFDGGRNAAAVVHDAERIVHVNRHKDVLRVPCHGFVNGVVDDFVDELMKSRPVAHVADVHAGTLTDGFEPFQNFDVRLVVARRRRLFRGSGGSGIFDRFNISHGSCLTNR